MKTLALVGLLTLVPVATVDAQQILLGVGSGVGDLSSNLFQITGYDTAPSAVDLGETGVVLSDVAVDPVTGKVYAIDLAGPNTLYSVNSATAAVTAIGTTGSTVIMNALEFDTAGTLYGWGNLVGDLFTIDVNSGLATKVGATGGLSAGDLTFDLDGSIFGASTTGLYRIDPATGIGAFVGPFGVLDIFGIEIDQDGRLFGFRSANSGNFAEAYSINKGTGAATLIGTVANMSTLGLYGVSFTKQCGFTKYGAGVATAQTMKSQWRIGAPPNHVNGTLTVVGGTPSGSALLLIGLQPASIVVGSNTVLVDLSPGGFFTTTVPLGPTGVVAFPLSAQLPTLAGTPLYVQALDFVGPQTSNGLRMSFCP